jgi:hypothetical protein
VADDGHIYRLPERLWPEEYDGPALVDRLDTEESARARVVGGEPAFWFGYPSIEYFETSTLMLQAPAPSAARSAVPLIAAPILAAGGLFLLRYLRRLN